MDIQRIALVGPGRAGSGLARALGAAGIKVSTVSAREANSAAPLAAELGAQVVPISAAGADGALVILAVPDGAIEAVSLQLGEAEGRVVHLAGSLGAGALALSAARGWKVGAWHPLFSFQKANLPDLRGVLFAVDGGPEISDELAGLTAALGGIQVRVASEARAAYHAAAVMASNFPVALLGAACRILEGQGMAREVATQGLVRLLGSSVAGIGQLRPAQALTGPVVRGDVDTVNAHLNVLEQDPVLARAYRALTSLTTELAVGEGRLAPADAARIRTLLETPAELAQAGENR